MLNKPLNHSRYLEGTSLEFDVRVDDPDLPHGDLLVVTVESNLSGILAIFTTTENVKFTSMGLMIGTHRITVTAYDGEVAISSWTEIIIEEEVVIPPEVSESTNWSLLGGVAIALLIAIVLVVFLLKGRGASEPEVGPTHGPSSDGEPIPPSGGYGVSGTGEPPAPLVDAPPPDPEQLAEEILEMLKALPRALPSELWGWGVEDLARVVATSERGVAPDGADIVSIDGKWYYADHGDENRFMEPVGAGQPDQGVGV
jgi:hypothetical protein